MMMMSQQQQRSSDQKSKDQNDKILLRVKVRREIAETKNIRTKNVANLSLSKPSLETYNTTASKENSAK